MKRYRYLSLIVAILLAGSCHKQDIPFCQMTITPPEGTLHNYFLFSAIDCSDEDLPGFSLKFRWDVDGDGIWETDFTNDREMAWKYTSPGKYKVRMEVLDPKGKAFSLENTVTVTDQNQPPVPYLKLSMQKAGITTPVLLDGSLSFDYEEYFDRLRYRWDFNSDKNWDTGFNTAATCIHIFEQAGTYQITLQVIDSDSASAQTTKSIKILNTNNLYSNLLDVRNNKIYPIVRIGNRWWMAENLDYGEVKTGTSTCTDNGVPEMYVYQDVYSNHNQYGGLYPWGEAVDYKFEEGAQGVCPAGWHIPSDIEWKELELALGMPADQLDSDSTNRGDPAGSYLETDGNSGFEAGLFGRWSAAVGYYGLKSEAGFWSSTTQGSAPWCRIIKNGSKGIQRLVQPGNTGCSVRCIKNE